MCVFSVQPNCTNVTAKLDNLIKKETAKDQTFFEQSAIYQHGLIGVAEDEDQQKSR